MRIWARGKNRRYPMAPSAVALGRKRRRDGRPHQNPRLFPVFDRAHRNTVLLSVVPFQFFLATLNHQLPNYQPPHPVRVHGLVHGSLLIDILKFLSISAKSSCLSVSLTKSLSAPIPPGCQRTKAASAWVFRNWQRARI